MSLYWALAWCILPLLAARVFLILYQRHLRHRHEKQFPPTISQPQVTSKTYRLNQRAVFGDADEDSLEGGVENASSGNEDDQEAESDTAVEEVSVNQNNRIKPSPAEGSGKEDCPSETFRVLSASSGGVPRPTSDCNNLESDSDSSPVNAQSNRDSRAEDSSSVNDASKVPPFSEAAGADHRPTNVNADPKTVDQRRDAIDGDSEACVITEVDDEKSVGKDVGTISPDEPNGNFAKLSEAKEQIEARESSTSGTDEKKKKTKRFTEASEEVTLADIDTDREESSGETEKIAGGDEDEGQSTSEVERDVEGLIRNSERAEKLKVEGNELYKSGEYVEAIEMYKRAFDSTPSTDSKLAATILCNIAAGQIALKNMDGAVESCSECLELDPSNVKARVRRFKAYKEMKKYHDAMNDLKTALELDVSLSREYAREMVEIERLSKEQLEKDKEEMIKKAKEFGNWALGKIGMSIDDFKVLQDPQTGSYNIQYKPGSS